MMPGSLLASHVVRHQDNLTSSKLRRKKFVAFQTQYKRDRGRVLRVLSGDDLSTPVPPKGSFDFWKGLFSRLSPEDHRTPFQLIRDDPSVIGAVSGEEVEATLAATPKTTAPGPDGRLVNDLKGLRTATFKRVVNRCLWFGALPSDWVTGRTILLLKVLIHRHKGIFDPSQSLP